jgi:hypothetical protein
MNYKYIFLLFFLAFVSCKENEVSNNPHPDNKPEVPENPEDPDVEEVPEITSFRINDVDFEVQDNLIIGFYNEELDNKNVLVATFTADGIVHVNGLVQESGVTVNDFRISVKYEVTSASGATKEYTVRYITFTGLAKLYITTDNRAKIIKEEYIPALFYIDPNHQYESEPIKVEGEIRGRGNTTWRMPKKPYKIKFESKIGLFNLPPHKTWVLLANYVDKTLMRNYLAYTLAHKMKSSFAPAAHFIEVFLNGVHQGNYLLTDQIEVASTRVKIPELNPAENYDLSITGVYLLEIDQRILSAKDEPYFVSHKFPIIIKSPEEPSELQLKYISDYVKEAEEALFGENFADANHGFRKYFDEESMIKWFIVCEVFKNVDSRNFSSIFLHKDRGGKLTMGPVWDFDLAAGNASHCRDCMESSGWRVMDNLWFSRMYEDPAFKANVKAIWNQYKSEIDDLLPEITELKNYLDLSQKRNFVHWPKFNDPGATAQNLPDYDSHVDYLYNFLSERINWMDNEFNR